MLYDIVIGNPLEPHVWSVYTDKYNSDFISCRALRQKVKLGGGVDKICSPIDELKITDGEIPVSIQGYELCKDIKFSNSNKNMKLTAIKLSEREGDNKVNYHIAYISFNPDDYELISYNLPNQTAVNICQTFRSFNKYQGCAIQYTSLYSALIKLTLRDIHNDTYHNIMIGVDENNKPKVVFKELDNDELSEAKEIYDSLRVKNKVKTKHFGITFNKRFIPTIGIFINAGEGDEKANSILDNSTYDEKSVVLLLSDENSLYHITDELNAVILEEITKKNIKAITICDLKLPPDFCKKYGIEYVFVYHPDTYKIKCIKGK
jgi:hypothetical protein|nr:MAG TPA: hypothetical protein [Caudoviricetes sp.]